VDARKIFERDGQITLPERRIEATDLGDVLVPAYYY
jgi:hypothetical protein